jgi:micrococcal nuclease
MAKKKATLPPSPYTYYADVLEVYDGDTLTVTIDLGFSLTVKTKVRLMGIDTAEMKSEDPEVKKLAIASRDFIRSQALDKKVLLKSHKPDKYGRALADIWTLDAQWQPAPKTLSEMMIEQGFAKAYDGGTKDQFTADDALNGVK